MSSFYSLRMAVRVDCVGITCPGLECMGVRQPYAFDLAQRWGARRSDTKLGAQLDLHGQQLDEALAKLDAHLTRLGELCHPGGVLLQVWAACLAQSFHSEHATTRPAYEECAVADRLVHVGFVQRFLLYNVTCVHAVPALTTRTFGRGS